MGLQRGEGKYIRQCNPDVRSIFNSKKGFLASTLEGKKEGLRGAWVRGLGVKVRG
jgi:hypothetical protein